ncbi:MAG: alpha/beta fold hydrolase, partial [Gammaproteobacteria bacterium]|nr:alpha/beta fold hydrolase [Gammaproteobacteria bacterium]
MTQDIDTELHGLSPATGTYAGAELLLEGPAGALEALTAYPEDYQQGAPIAVICHPHSLYGGSMSNKVVYMIARTFAQMGAATLCFNFRGVGKSQGSFDQGQGESEDLAAVVSWLRRRHPQSPLWLAGFSFGAYVSARSCEEIGPERLLLVAPPVSMFDFSSITPIQVPYMVIQGGSDEVIDPEAVGQWVVDQPQRPIYHWMSDSGHFFHGRLNRLRDVILRSWGPE